MGNRIFKNQEPKIISRTFPEVVIAELEDGCKFNNIITNEEKIKFVADHVDNYIYILETYMYGGEPYTKQIVLEHFKNKYLV